MNKATESKPAARTDPARPAKDEPTKVETPKTAPGECVVDAPFHVGRAVNGLVCSYHAMHYDANGNRR